MSETDSNRGNRDERGRFAQGNPGGPGNPKLQRLSEYREAIRSAVSVEDLTKVFKKLTSMALDGDIMAIKELALRTLGKPSQPSDDAITGFELPPITSIESLREAGQTVIQAASNGVISPQGAAIFSGLLETQRRIFETSELEERIRQLEVEKDRDG
jgi:hypothetical protein